MSRRALPFALAALVIAGCGGSAGDAPPDRVATRALPNGDFAGIVAEDVLAGDSAYRQRTLELLAGLGVGTLRQTFDWARMERAPGRYEFRMHDEFVAAAAEAGIQILPILFNPPPFASSAPRRSPAEGTYPPRDPEDLGRFAAEVARRYGAGGTFWRDHPDLPQLPVRAWQVWNEPSLPAYWPDGPDPAAYVELLEAAGRGIRAVDPSAEIVTAGLPESRLGMPFDEFVEGMYAAGARGSFDALAIHPYARDAEATIAAVERARTLIRANGDDAAIWVTELGWASGGPPSPFTVGEQSQSEFVEKTVEELGRRRQGLGVRGFVYFGWRDARPYAGGRDFWGLHTGLLELDGTPKPALGGFERALRTIGAAPDPEG